MIKIEIQIKQRSKKEIEDLSISNVYVNLKEEGFNVTKNEKETSEIIKKRLNLQQKIEILENGKETPFCERLKELLKYLK